MSMRSWPQVSLPLLTLLTIAGFASLALAGWPADAYNSAPVCQAPGDQHTARAASDGAGGLIIAWKDYRGGVMADIFAQHVLVSGDLDPAWPADGLAVCIATGSQGDPMIVTDGAGGAVIAWPDPRGGDNDIYAQRVRAGGTVDPAWPVNGRAVCTAIGSQYLPDLVPDGAGGAYIAWRDDRTVGDIYAHHILGSGLLDVSWPVDGRAVCTATSAQTDPRLVGDGGGGIIVTWSDHRSTTSDIYAQRVLASGAVDPVWPADGRAVCTAANSQFSPRIVNDGLGGVIIAWYDNRSGTYYDIYATRVIRDGTFDNWPSNGRQICTEANQQNSVELISDGAGGAILAWADYRSGTNYDIYAHHVLNSGNVDAAWPVNGRAVCTAANDQDYPYLVSDGAGGAIIVWDDERNGLRDIYAQRVKANGAVDALWPANGSLVCGASSSQGKTEPLTDGAGGVMVVFSDSRGETLDIWAQRLARHGFVGAPEPVIAGVADVPNDQGGVVKLSWAPSYLEPEPHEVIDYYRVFRSLPPNLAKQLVGGGARPLTPEQAAAATGAALAAGLVITETDGQTYYWQFMSTVYPYFLDGYSTTVVTGQDSTAAGAPLTAFMVQAATSSGMHWESLPAFGYSVDNLAPAMPAPLTGRYADGATRLRWHPNAEADLAGYRLYRGADASFVPGPGNLVAALADTGYAAAGAPAWFKLTAVDIHDNESPVAVLRPDGLSGVADDGSVRFAFAAPAPNPAALQAGLQFSLARPGPVRLVVHDLAGRRVRTLVDGPRAAGNHAESWNLRDDAGRRVAAGKYIARLVTAEGERTRALLVVP